MKNENVTLDEAALILKHTVSFYTGDSEKWAKFLKQSAYLYKYDIINQFLIANYSYGRNVTAAASESEWKRLKASVNENAEGIPVVKKNNEGKREISYVYDISDTDSDYKIWQPDKTSDDTVKAVSNYFKASGDNFKAAVDNSILDIAGENFSPTDKDWNDLILNSIKYIVYTRCGLDTDGIALDSLSAIQNFHSVDTTENLNFTLNSLNKNILKPAENVLRGIERSVIAVDRQKKLTAEKTAEQVNTTDKAVKKNDIRRTENSNIIGNTAYRYIANKTYRKIEISLTAEISKRLEEENIKFSGKINSDNTTTLTFNRQDLKAVQQIIGQAKNKGRYFTDEEVQSAKAVNLVDYLGYRGENLKRVGNNEYTLPEHDSMRISGNKYYWNSRSKGGNSVDFCMNYYNITFQEAVKSLLDYSGNMSKVQPQAEKQTTENIKAEDPAKPISFPLSEKTGRVFKYLTESRGLSADIVNSLINEGKIAQDINGNAVFKVFDKNGELNGSEVSGTSQRRYKQTTGLDGNGFTVNPTGTYTPEKAIFFESAIDLLSYYELHKDETALLISMGGLKDKTVLKVMEDYSLSGENCFVAVDNDEAGVNFTNKMKNEYNINAYPITEDERFNLHENIKDWNDLLKAEKKDKTEHLTAYHTTDVDFDTFKPGYRGVIWTEKNLEFAKSRMAGMGSDRIFTCDVTMKKPLHITYDSGENWDIDSTIRKARNQGYDGVVIDFKLADDVINNSLFQFVLTRNLEADARDILYSIVKANASDALENETLKDFFDRIKANNYITHSYVAVFKPEQVKITDKILLNEQPEIGSVEQESEAELKKSFQAALQNHETFYIKHTEENFENYRIAYDDKENHYNIIADRIYPIAKIRESNIIEESLAADIDVDSVIDIIKSYDNEISPENLKTQELIQQEKQLTAQAEQTVINNFMKNYINSDSIFCPNLDLGEFFAVTNELFYYENSTHNVNEKIIELAAKYRNGETISTELGKYLDCETHIKIDADEERYDAGLPNDKDLYADIFVEKDENGLTFKFGNTKRFCTWEEYSKGQFEYLKDSFRSRILSEYADEETAPPLFNSYGEELPEPERTMPEEKLNRLLARLDGKELTANLVGEFYEFYDKDAQAAAEVLGFKLTHKNINGVSVPMVGFPKFAFADNERKLMNSGYTLNVKENTGKINAILSAAEKYNPLYFKDNNVSEQYISDARRSVFKYTRLVNDNGNYRLVANRISPSLALDVVLSDFVSLNAAAEYAEANNFEIDYELSEREKSAQIEWNKMKKENESLINNNVFEYQGYHFKPVGNFKANADFNSLSRSMRSHSSPYMSVYEDSKISYSHEDFYRASNNSTADVFLCAETGKAFSPAENELFEFTGEYETIFSVDKSSLPFAVGDSIVYADGLHERLWKVTDIENFTVTLSRKTGTFLRPNKETESFDLYNDEDTIYVNLEDVVEYFNDHYEKFNALKTALENHEPVYLIGNEEILHNPRIEYADGFRIASDDEYGGIHARRLVNMDVMSIIKYIKDEEYRIDYSRLGLTKTVDLEVEESEPEVSEKEAFAPEYIYKMEVNPKTTGRENLYFIQSYLTKQDGKADVGDILYLGTPEKCQELMEKLNAGELTQDDVKAIYRKSVEQTQTNSDKDSFSVYQLKSGDETRYHRYTSYDDLQKSGLSVDNSNYNLVYKSPIEPKTSLENIFFLLNTKLPEDFKGHSLSVSDIIVLHKDGQDKAYYVDSVGFKEVPEFLHQQEISKEAEKNENTEKSSIHFGLLGNGITVYDISREKNNDYLTVAHISDEGVVKYYVDDLKETDKELIEKEADRQKTAFTEKWNELSVEKKYDRILATADTNQLVQITGDMISTEDRVKKYEHSVIFKDEDFPKDFKSSIIGNTPYRYIPKKQYKKISNDSDFTNSAVEKIGSLFESAGIKYSGIIRKDFTTITFSKNDIEKVQPIIDSVINQKVEVDKKVEAIEENTKIEKKAENTDVENTAEKVAPTIMQTDIDSVLSKGSGFQSGKYRIYRQFQKQEKSKVNADFLKKEYGSGSGSHAFSDGVIGWSSFDAKGLSITKYGNYDNPDVKMSWSQVEKQIKRLISEDRYFMDEDNTKYPEFLKSINAPQYEIDNFIKSVHQKFIQSKSKLPPDEKRDSLALRLSDFIRDLDGYEQGLLKEVGRADLANISADEMEKHLGEPETVQQLLDFLKNVQGATSDVYSRSNAWYFRQELSQLHFMQYVCHTDDIVYIDSSKFEILKAENNNFILRNVEMPLDTRNLSFEELQKQLSGDKSNDIYKRVVIENSADNEQLSPNPSIDVKQMQVGSLDKISNARLITFQSFSQNIIDLFLQQGSNTENARMMIATEFMKQKTEDEIAESLKNIYHGGFGIQAGNRIISAWYDEDGINISSGRTARYKGDAQVITWNEAADRIGQLLKNGDFASNVELVEAPGFEKRQLAEKIVNLYRDLSDEGSKQNLFSTLKNSGLPVGFPESTDFLNEKLNNSEFRKALSSDFDEFKTAYKQNREVLRFHYHKVDSIDRDLKELELPRISFESNMTAVPNINGFITDDEINADLVGGSGFENGKSRIYDFFTEKHTSDEKAAFLRDEYGIGGHSHALSGAFGSWQEHNSKGLLYSKSGCEDVKLNWLQASKRINELIKNKQYISRKEKNILEEKQIDEQEVNAEQHSKNDINISVPEEKIISFTPIYKNTGKYAAENGETDLFRASNRENRRCREAIEKTISENFDGMHLDKNAVDKVVEQFGIDRVSYLLAATIKAKKDYDKRFSDSNIKWADTIDTSFRSPDSFSEIINSHSTILDEFTKQFREGIEKERELEKPPKEKTFEDISEDINKPVEYFTPTVKAVINDLSSISGKRYNVQIWSNTDGKNYTDTGNGRYFNDLDRAKSFAAEIIEGKYNDIIAFTAKYDEIYKELGDSLEKLNEYKITGEDFDETVNNDSYNYYLKYISIRGDDFVGDREQTAFVLALNEVSRQKNLDIAETAVEPEPSQGKEYTTENFRITNYDLGVGSPKEKYNRNIEAIKTLFKIENEGRQANTEEQEILSKYVGWGGLPEVFDSAKSTWHNEYEEVKSLLSESEYKAARGSTLNAHYTTPLVISSIYKVLESAGFTGGKILEPAMGIGNFFGLLPENMKDSELYGVELDSITGRIAKQLYPNADIQVKGFEKTDFDSGFFDAAVGNVPFGNYRLYDEEFHDGELIHDFFFKKSLDKVRPGGIVAFVTSKGTLDKADTKVREYLAQRADLLGAIRLPNTAFKKNANTEVTADILFLKKRENLRDFEKDGEPEWTETTTTLDGLPINSYFVSHPQMVLGEMKEVTRRYGKETACLPFENKSLDELLEEAVSELGKDIAAMDKNDLKNVVTADTVEKGVITENENIKLKEIVLELNKPVVEQKETVVEQKETIIEETEPVIEDVEETKPIAEPPKKNIYPLNYRNFCYCNIDGDIYYRENKNMEKQDFSKKHIKNAEDRVKGMIEISGCLQELIRFQKENYEDEYIIKQQNKLNELYNNFTEKYGLLSDKSNRSLFLNDDTYPLLQSLENINSKGELESKADIFTKRTIVPYVEIDSVDTAAEALAVSISEKAGVDIDFMARLCSKTNDEVINDLEGIIFKNPVTQKYETSDEYLSGNVREKLRTAEIAAKKDSSYNINVSFLKEAQPKDLTPEEISVQLGSTWVPTKYYEQFMYELLDTPDRCQSDRINAYSGDPFKSMGRGANSNIIAIDYNNYSATYAISNKENYKADKQNFKAVETYGTGRINAYKIIEDTLNMKTVKIVDYVEDINGKVKAVPNEKETILAQEKQALIKSKFREWIFDDAERTADLCKIYNEKFNSVRPREYSGKHINFVGMNPEIVLKEHQKNAIAHTLYGKNTLLAHSVGSGKTYEMVASAMESKRLGLCTKSLIVVPKHIVNQTAKEFLQLYPAANILVPNENDFTAKNRQKFCSRISTGNYDAIIISHNQFEKIPLSIERQIAFIEEEIDEITKNLEMLKNQRGERGYTVKDLERTRKNLENTLETLNNNKKRDTVVTFEELGVDKLYVDEVQAFKNLFLVSKMGRNVAGINTSSRSQRATDLYMKCQYLDEKTSSKGTVFATGTPLSNSMTELYTMQKYLQQDELKARGLNNFDSWASCFGETQTALELAPEGKGYQMKTRFSRFFNLPELMSFFKETADIKVADELNLPVPKTNFHNIATEPSRFQQDMVSDLAVRAKRIRDRAVRPEVDNMLKVTNDGRKLALDQRIANPLLPDDPGSKVNVCINNVFDIWKDTAEEKSTQLIFCDLSTPGGTGFNVYNDIKNKLIDKGVPSEEIAFIHDCKTDKQKQELFTKVNNGEVRVLLGSTSKMGTGTNCQQRLKALHHIDCPYRPSDLQQRNGRIIRQGNSNKEVDIYSYVTKGTFDSYIYQLLENKQKFISQIMTSKSPVRSAEDVDETVLSYSQIKALAAGDPKIKEKMDLDIDLARLRTLFADYQSTKRHLQNDILNKYPSDIKQLEQHIDGLEKDIALGELTKDDEFSGITIYGKNYTDKKEAGTALISACQMFPTDAKSREIGEYRGFKAILSFDSFAKGFNLTLKNATSITVPLGQDPYGNFTRLNNAIANFPKELETHKAALENTMKNLKNAKEELTKPFARIDELHEKEKRIAELNKELTMGNIADTAKTEPENEANIAEVKNKPVKAEYAAAL